MTNHTTETARPVEPDNAHQTTPPAEHGVPDWMVAYLDGRDAQRAHAVESFLASLTPFERGLVHDCAVMGYVRGMTHPAGKEIPRDSAITAEVIDACHAFPDLYLAVNAPAEQRGPR